MPPLSSLLNADSAFAGAFACVSAFPACLPVTLKEHHHTVFATGIPSFATGVNSQGFSPPMKTDDLFNTLRQAAQANDRAWVAANTAQNALSAATAAVQQAVMLIMNQKASGPAITSATPFTSRTPIDDARAGMMARGVM